MVFSCSKVSQFRMLVNNLLELFLHSLHSITGNRKNLVGAGVIM
jgi:hypothetical protein